MRRFWRKVIRTLLDHKFTDVHMNGLRFFSLNSSLIIRIVCSLLSHKISVLNSNFTYTFDGRALHEVPSIIH